MLQKGSDVIPIISKRRKKIYKHKCNICGNQFILGQSFEKIITHSKNTIYIHTECAYGKEPIIHIKPKQKQHKTRLLYDQKGVTRKCTI